MFCTTLCKISTGHKIQTQSYERHKFHLLPNGNSFPANQAHQGKGRHLLLFSCKRRAGLQGSLGFPSSNTPLDLSPPRKDLSLHPLDREIAAKPAVYLSGDSSSHMVTPTKCPLLSPSFRQNYHHQAFRAYQVICGNSPEIN